MEIVVIINVHNNPPVVRDAIDSVMKWVTNKIVVVVDAAGWCLFENFKFPECVSVVKGLYHARSTNPYQNICIGMDYAYRKYPDADWYNYIEYDVLYLNDLFKEDLAARSEYANLGFIHHKADVDSDGWLPRKILNMPDLQAYYMLGAVNFYSHKCIKQLVEWSFFTKVIEETKGCVGYLPNFAHCGVEEIIFPTAAGAVGPVGNLTNYENTIVHSGFGNICERYAVRFAPEISTADLTPYTSIAHPVKTLQRRKKLSIMQYYQEKFLADFLPQEAVFFDANKGVVVWKDGKPLQPEFPTPLVSCLECSPEVRLKGRKVMHGILAHTTEFGTITSNTPNLSIAGPASTITYKLNKRYQGLKGSAGISENAAGYNSSIVFCVLGDGEIIWRSKPMSTIGQVEDFELIIENVDTLELVAITLGLFWSCQAVWDDLVLFNQVGNKFML